MKALLWYCLICWFVIAPAGWIYIRWWLNNRAWRYP